jgi:hypothetical protein
VRNRLTVKAADKDPNFTYRWINDKDSRLADAQQAGYEFVTDDIKAGDPRAAEASQMDSRVSKPAGGGLTTYLMRIPNDYYKEDQKAKADTIDEMEKSLKPDKSKGQYGQGLTND